MIAVTQCPDATKGQITITLDGKVIGVFGASLAGGQSYIHTLSYHVTKGDHTLGVKDQDGLKVDAISVVAIDYVGVPDGSSGELKPASGFGGCGGNLSF